MANLNLPNVREGGDIRFRIGLEDNGVAVDWSGLEGIRVFLYADAQKQVSGECTIEVDAEDNTVLACLYSGDDPQFRGINSVLVRAKYQGEIKVYDKPAINIVARTADADGVLVIDDPVVPVQINVEEVSTSLLNNAIDAAINAAAGAEKAIEDVRDEETAIQEAEAARVLAEQGRVSAEQSRVAQASADHTLAGQDHTRAESDHGTASDDHTLAVSDHGVASGDHTTALGDHSLAESDHTRAESDHGVAGSDHTIAQGDHTQAGSDHSTAVADHTQAGADHTVAGQDHTQAGTDHNTAASDHTQAGLDHTQAGEDHTQALADHQVMAGYDNRLGAVEGEVDQLEAKVDKLDCGLALMTRTASPAGSMAIPILELNKQYYVKFNLSATKTFAVTLRKQDGSSGAISQTIAASKEYAPGEYFLPFVFTDSDGVYLRIGEAGVWSSVSNIILYQSSVDSIRRINGEIAPINDELEELTARVGGTTKSDTITEVNDVIWDGTKFIAPTAALKGYYFPIYKGTRYTWVVNSGTVLSIGLFGVKPEDGAIAPRLQNLTSLSSYDCEEDGLYIAFAFQFPTSTYGSPSLTITKNYSGVADEVGAIEQEVSEVTGELAVLNSDYTETKTDVSGLNSVRSYTETDYDGIYWDGEKFVAGDANYNSFVIRLYRSGHYEWKVPTGTPISIGIFGKKPVIGEYASRLRNLTNLSSYDCENDGYYLVATFSVSPSPVFELTSVMLGVFNALYGYKKDSVLDNTMLANIIYDGSKFISVASDYAYNSIVIPLIKGRTYSWATTKTNIANVKVYDAKPEAGLVINPVRDITSRSPFTCKNDGYYMVFLFNLTQDNVIDVRFNIAESGYIQKIDGTMSFKGKTIVCIGDSTTEGINDTDEFGGYRRGLGSGYPSYLQEYYGGTFINGGIGGTNLVPRARGGADAPYEYLDGVNLVNAIVTGTWEDQIQAATDLSAQDDKLLPAVTALSELDWSKVDAIVLKYGINDWGTSMPLGTIDSTSPSDYYGAINLIVQKLCTAFPGKQILFITHEAGYHGAKADEYWSSTWKNSQNLTMEDYVAANIAGCAKWCLPCFDLYHCFGVNKYNWATFYGTDYIHPIRAGYQKMADVLSKYLLEKICPR